MISFVGLKLKNMLTESDYNSMTILELHALAQEVRLKLSYELSYKKRLALNKQLKQIETNIDERYLDC